MSSRRRDVIARAVGATAMAAVIALAGGSAAWANPAPDSGPDTGGTAVTLPAPPGGLAQVMEHGHGNAHSLALGSDGVAYAWGFGSLGRLGNGGTTDSSVPVAVQVPAGVTFTRLAAGSSFSAALGSDGLAYAWGNNSSGQLGNGTTANSSVPVQVQTPAGVTVTEVVAGGSFAAAVGSDGNLYAWGAGGGGRLGNGATTSSSLPVVVQAPAGVTLSGVALGFRTAAALGSDGNTYVWGANDLYLHGNGTTSSSAQLLVPSPVTLPAGVTFSKLVFSHVAFAAALGTDGNLYVWGSNLTNLIPGGSPVSAVPVQALTPAGVSITAVATTIGGLMVVDSNGQAYGFGNNQYGKLGDGTTTNITSLTALPIGVVAVTDVAFDGVSGTGLTDNGDGTVSVVAPAHAAGPVDVTVSYTRDGVAQPPISYAAGYTYASTAVLPTISTNPAGQTIAAGGSATFTIAVTGTPAPSVAWEVSSDGGTVWQPVAADAAATVAPDGLSVTVANAPAGHDGFRYRAIASNSAGSAVSTAATLTVTASGTGTATSGGTGTGGGTGSTQLSTTGGGSPIPLFLIAGAGLLAGAGILARRLVRRRAHR